MNLSAPTTPAATDEADDTLILLRDMTSLVETAKKLHLRAARIAREKGNTWQAVADHAGLKSRGHAHDIVTADLDGAA